MSFKRRIKFERKSTHVVLDMLNLSAFGYLSFEISKLEWQIHVWIFEVQFLKNGLMRNLIISHTPLKDLLFCSHGNKLPLQPVLNQLNQTIIMCSENRLLKASQ